jgi:hypothetical protein
MKLVLLHDTDEMDFGNDVLQFLKALNLDVGSVMLAPNRGRTLAGKEQAILDGADVFVFLLTPGSSRHDQTGYASQSVCEEMGRAKERFKTQPERVIYLADSKWRPQAIDQIAYTTIDRANDRSIVQGLTQLALELRELGALRINVAPRAPEIGTLAKNTPADIKKACAYVAELPNGVITFDQLDAYLLKSCVNRTDANILKNKLIRFGWITHIQKTTAFSLSHWGYDVVEYERKNPPPAYPSILGLPRSWALPPSRLQQMFEGLNPPKQEKKE